MLRRIDGKTMHEAAAWDLAGQQHPHRECAIHVVFLGVVLAISRSSHPQRHRLFTQYHISHGVEAFVLHVAEPGHETVSAFAVVRIDGHGQP